VQLSFSILKLQLERLELGLEGLGFENLHLGVMGEFLDHLVFELDKDFLFMPKMPQGCCSAGHMILKGCKGREYVLGICYTSIDTTARSVQKGIGLPL
jgi:hypothetical protein